MKKIYILSDAKDLPTHKNCEDAIKEAGGGAVLCNLHASDEQFTDADGFLIPGGWDINPALYHEENTASLNISDELDYFQMQAVCYAVSHKIPILQTKSTRSPPFPGHMQLLCTEKSASLSTALTIRL